eukprot:m.1665281 g.1665281  ORF g.1665281 m.1665281 type:complete len:59 (-) comp141361_c0_seq1:63-239(-)
MGLATLICDGTFQQYDLYMYVGFECFLCILHVFRNTCIAVPYTFAPATPCDHHEGFVS